MPGSGDKVPAELRLVLAGYVGIACGVFASALAYATLLSLSPSTPATTWSANVLFFSFPSCMFIVGASGVRAARGLYPVFPAASAAQRSTYGHGDGLEAWWADVDT